LKPIRILLWNPLINPGGGSRFLSQLAPALSRQKGIGLVRVVLSSSPFFNHTASIVLGSAERLQVHWLKPTALERLAAIEASVSRRDRSYAFKALLRRYILPHYLSQIRKIQVRRLSHGCDVLYSPWPHLQEFPDVDLPVVVTFQDAIFFDFPEILSGPSTYVEWKRAKNWLQRSARVVVSSQATREALYRHFGDISESVEIIPHAIAPQLPQLVGEPKAGEPAMLPDNYIVCVTNITTHKNLYMLLNAWARFEQRKEFPLVIIGPETYALGADWTIERNRHWQQDQLLGVVIRTGLRRGEEIYALGYVSEAHLNSILKRATALILPSLAEGGGSYPVEEALNMGIPVLCADIPVMREQLAKRTAKIGWFDPISVDSILSALDDFVANLHAYKLAAIKGRKDPRPTWDEIARQYAQILISVTGHGNDIR